MAGKRKSDEEYFKITKERILRSILIKNECWEWFLKTKIGYGSTRFRSKPMLAHRMTWHIFKGEIPKGQCVLHKCDNRACVNPDHLFLGRQKENIKDMFNKKRKNHKGINHPRAKLTEKDILRIRNVESLHMTRKQITKKYSLSDCYVRNILVRNVWKHI